MQEAGLDGLFLPPSADLEYLTGLQRDLPSFGEVSYAHGWVTGGLLAPGREPLFVLRRMYVACHRGREEQGEVVVVNEADDGRALFGRALGSLGPLQRVGVAARAWAETVLELQRALPGVELLSGTPIVNGLRRVKSQLELD